jgi:Domain of unknown function (DUF397)
MKTSSRSRDAWRKSTYSGQNGDCVEIALVPAWQTSTHSGTNGACVEVARNMSGIVAVRDSKDRSGPVLTFTPAEWQAFTAEVRSGSDEPALRSARRRERQTFCSDLEPPAAPS